MHLPSVSIVILTYKRQAALLQAIATALQQDYPDFEVLVVDNHSEDDTAALVQQKFPHVRCLVLPQNLGAAGRNAGFEAARGEFVVTLDNDVYFESAQELRKIVALFGERPNVACLTFRILQPESGALSVRDWFHPRSHFDYDRAEFPTYYIAEGASAFRKKVLDKTGGYDEQLFLGHEGFDLAMRLFEAGFDIHYTPAIQVRHYASLETRASWRPYFYNTRNYFIIGWKYFRLGLSLRFLLPRIAMLALFAMRTGNLRYYFKGLAAGINERRNLKAPRAPMSESTERKILELSAFRPGLLFWFRKHSKKPLL
jgi:GT2 family glycosyltransferase